jgi:hypothetical protein
MHARVIFTAMRTISTARKATSTTEIAKGPLTLASNIRHRRSESRPLFVDITYALE